MSIFRILLVFVGLIGLLCLYLLINTLRYPFKELPMQAPSQLKPVYSQKAIERLAGGLRIPTISAQKYQDTDFAAFDKFKTYLSDSYPLVYANLDNFTINEYGLVFHWRGKNPSLKPILFLSHYDVVPVAGSDPAQDHDDDYSAPPDDGQQPQGWTHAPFSGQFSDDSIYGRGALDMKGMLFALLEASELLLEEGFQPEQDIWFAFGQDEEVGGREGAVKIAAYFQEQGLVFDAVFDEGGIIAGPNSAISSIARPLALVGVAEKGYLSLQITVRGQGGHSSMPPAKTSLVYAAEIVEKLNSQQLPAKIIPPVESFFQNVGGEMDVLSKVAIANQSLLKPVLLNNLAKQPASNALIRTTTAVTMMSGSAAPNVISSQAEIVVNFRLLPGDSVQAVVEHVQNLCSGYDVVITPVLATREASSLTSEATHGFRKIAEIVPKLVPDAIVTSYITIGGTDAYKYQIVSDNIYRFMPVLLSQQEQRTIHNEDEHITVENYGLMISFFKEMMSTYHE